MVDRKKLEEFADRNGLSYRQAKRRMRATPDRDGSDIVVSRGAPVPKTGKPKGVSKK